MPVILKKAKENKFANGEAVSYGSNNLTIINDKIKLNDGFRDGDEATANIIGGVLDGTICTFSASDEINASYELNGDRLTIRINDSLLLPDQVDYFYSIDDGEYNKYSESVLLEPGDHNVKVKFFERELLNENISVNIKIYAIRKNGKIYIYTNSNGSIKYSLTGEDFINYDKSITNEDATSIFVQIENNQAEEVEIEERDEIYDVKTNLNLFEIDRHAYRENGKIIVNCSYEVDSTVDYYYSFDNSIYDSRWTSINSENLTYNESSSDPKIIKITVDETVDADVIYIKAIKRDDHGSVVTSYVLDYDIGNIDYDRYSGIIGTYNENNKNYIFGQDRIYNMNTYEEKDGDRTYTKNKYLIVDDDIDIQEYSDEKVIDVTNMYGDTFILKEDGKIYRVLSSINDLQLVKEGEEFVQIEGPFAMDSANKIWKCVYNSSDDTYSYSPYRVNFRSAVEKLSYTIDGKDEVPIGLKANGCLIIPRSMWDETTDRSIIDIETQGDRLFVLKRNSVSYNGTDIDLSTILGNGEIPMKINKNGSIFTNKGNVYDLEEISENTYRYTESPVLTNVKRFGNYSYQTEDGKTFLRSKQKINKEDSDNITSTFELIEDKVYNKKDEDIIITKDETKLDEDKVIINVDIPDNKYIVKKPDNTQVENDCEYVVTKNGEFVFEFTNKENGQSQIRVVHVNTIQSRKEMKVPEVAAINGKIKLISDDRVEYSTDNINWTEYENDIEYERPIYARVVNDNFECSIIKITINENSELNVENKEARQIKEEILTNSIGVNYEKEIKTNEGIQESTGESNNQNNSLFDYISQIAENIIYSFSTTDGKFAGCYFDDNVTEITYKDMDNNVNGINGDNYHINNDDKMEYAIIMTGENIIMASDDNNEEAEQAKVESGEIISYKSTSTGWRSSSVERKDS